MHTPRRVPLPGCIYKQGFISFTAVGLSIVLMGCLD